MCAGIIILGEFEGTLDVTTRVGCCAVIGSMLHLREIFLHLVIQRFGEIFFLAVILTRDLDDTIE